MSLITEESKKEDTGLKYEYKGYNIVKAKDRPGLYEIRTKVGARPEMLSGHYTSPQFAETDIIVYLNKKEQAKVVKA